MKIKFTLLFLLFVFSINVAMASNYYWVGGAGNWSDFGNQGATTSEIINDEVYEESIFISCLFVGK